MISKLNEFDLGVILRSIRLMVHTYVPDCEFLVGEIVMYDPNFYFEFWMTTNYAVGLTRTYCIRA